MNQDPKEEKMPRPIDVDAIDLEKMKDKTADNPGLLPYAHTTGSAVIKPEDEGSIKGNALEAMKQQTGMQMEQIYRQMQLLADQAKEISRRVEISQRIYGAEMRFSPLIGHIYYLYQKHEGGDVLSIVAPAEWGRSKKYAAFVAKVRLLADHTWEVIDV